MVAVQMLLMNYFLLGLHTESHLRNDVLPPEEILPCSFGCSKCSIINGCYACKPPFLLSLHRVGHKQPGVCKRDCPKGFFGSYIGKQGFCIQCEIHGCKVCSSRNFCLGCQRGKVLFNGRCKKKCPTGFPYDPYKKSCSREKKAEINGTTVDFSLERRVNLQTVLYSTKKELKKEERRIWKEKRRSIRRRRKKEKRKRMRLKEERKEELKRARRRHHRRKRRRKQRRKSMTKLNIFKNSTNPS